MDVNSHLMTHVARSSQLDRAHRIVLLWVGLGMNPSGTTSELCDLGNVISGGPHLPI